MDKAAKHVFRKLIPDDLTLESKGNTSEGEPEVPAKNSKSSARQGKIRNKGDLGDLASSGSR